MLQHTPSEEEEDEDEDEEKRMKMYVVAYETPSNIENIY